jgi:hypothetical protein
MKKCGLCRLLNGNGESSQRIELYHVPAAASTPGAAPPNPVFISNTGFGASDAAFAEIVRRPPKMPFPATGLCRRIGPPDFILGKLSCRRQTCFPSS